MEIWCGKGDVDGGGDVVGDDDGLVVEKGAGGGGLRKNEGKWRKRVFREF